MSLNTELIDLLASPISDLGFRLWDVKVTKAGKRQVVSVTLDKDSGANLDEIASASKAIAPLLDDLKALEDGYHLEVSSPGLERSLSRPEHFKWSIGHEVAISHRVDGSLERTRGKLVRADDEGVVVENESEIAIPIDAITKAHTLFDFEAAMKKDFETLEETKQ